MTAKIIDSTQQQQMPSKNQSRSILLAVVAIVLLAAAAAMFDEKRPLTTIFVSRFWTKISTRSSGNKGQHSNTEYQGPTAALRKLDAISDDPGVLNVHVGTCVKKNYDQFLDVYLTQSSLFYTLTTTVS